MFVVYVLYNKSRNKIYIGYTSDLEKRLERHNSGRSKKSSYTYKNSGKWKLVYKENFETRIEATKREKQLKSYQGRKFIKEKVLAL